jgi:hypothetical protein
MPSSILACAAYVLPFQFILSLWGNRYLPTQSICFSSEHRSTHYLLAAGLPVKKHFGAVDKSVPWDAWKLSLTVPIVAHLVDAAISLSHNFLSAEISCTIDGETRGNVLPESLQQVPELTPTAAFSAHLRRWPRSASEEFYAE